MTFEEWFKDYLVGIDLVENDLEAAFEAGWREGYKDGYAYRETVYKSQEGGT